MPPLAIVAPAPAIALTEFTAVCTPLEVGLRGLLVTEDSVTVAVVLDTPVTPPIVVVTEPYELVAALTIFVALLARVDTAAIEPVIPPTELLIEPTAPLTEPAILVNDVSAPPAPASDPVNVVKFALIPFEPKMLEAPELTVVLS
jgi:hypothetical protein